MPCCSWGECPRRPRHRIVASLGPKDCEAFACAEHLAMVSDSVIVHVARARAMEQS
jgi:hypothetical protein